MSLAEIEATELEGEEAVGRWRDAWRRLLANKAAVAGMILIVVSTTRSASTRTGATSCPGSSTGPATPSSSASSRPSSG
jgi:hypothetical protein